MVDELAGNLPIDKYQASFCENDSRAIRLLAPAGSGKTHSLIYRCLCLSRKNPSVSSRFLIFTFTRAARDELRDRLTAMSDFNAIRSSVEITTLNAWGFRRLKGKLHSLQVCTTAKDRYFCVNNILQASWKDCPHLKIALDSRYKAKTSQDIMEWVDKLKGLGFRHDKLNNYRAFKDHVLWLIDNGMSPHIIAFLAFMRDLEIISPGDKPEIEFKKIYDEFMTFWIDACNRMYDSSFISLEDQKYWAVIDLENSKPTTGMHRQDHILVDEFQDVNVLDLELLKAVATVNKTNLTLVGDDDQAIYEWRGATPRFILNPEKYLGIKYETCVLENNYRSARNIVTYSQKLIKKNKNRVDKTVKSISKIDAAISVISMPTLNDSINYVTSEVKSILNKPNEKLVIISRKRSQIIPYQIVFASDNIPFCAAEDLQLFLSDAFKSLANMLLIKTHSEVGFFPGIDFINEILLLCNEIRHYPLNKADRENLRRYFLKQRPKNLPDALNQLRAYPGSLKGDATGTVTENFFRAISNFINAKTVSETVDCISQDFNGMQRDYGRGLEDIFYADPPFLYLSEYAQRYGEDFMAFCDDIQKATDTLVRIPPDDDEVSDLPWKKPVHLMTALRAKGKEFDNVIILDANDGIWPIKMAQSQEQLEQERRLFYVAFTRAKKRLTILVNQSMLGQTATPSPYIAEMGLPIRRV